MFSNYFEKDTLSSGRGGALRAPPKAAPGGIFAPAGAIAAAAAAAAATIAAAAGCSDCNLGPENVRRHIQELENVHMVLFTPMADNATTRANALT